MIHHIRFLKLPRVEVRGPSSLIIKALITITTDLGDSFFPSQIVLSAGLWFDGHLLAENSRFAWKHGMRSLWIEFMLTKTKQLRWPLQMHVSHAPGGQALNLLSVEHLPQIIDVSSPPFPSQGDGEGSKRVIRMFQLAPGQILRIHEDTGDSIARHIWDAGIALIACLCSHSGPRLHALCPLFSQLLRPAQSQRLNVLELGSGCGIVGKALASIRPDCHVILSDLIDAMELILHNIADSQLASGSRLSSMILDWGQELPASITAEQFDLILVCDCTYNSDSIPALVKTLSALIARLPAAMVVVANKIRHDSELSFFVQMADAGLVEVEQLTLPIRGGSPTAEDASQNIHVHVYLGEEARQRAIPVGQDSIPARWQEDPVVRRQMERDL